jgi:hypothetical protein
MRLRDSNDQLAIDGRQPPELKKIEKKEFRFSAKIKKLSPFCETKEKFR